MSEMTPQVAEQSRHRSRHPVIARAVVWLDADGKHVWFAHDCTEGRTETMLPWPTWQVGDDGQQVGPSIDCRACGVHAYFSLRTDAPSIERGTLPPGSMEWTETHPLDGLRRGES